MNFIKEDSPFTPGKPVPIDFFVGRQIELERIFRAIGQVKAGKQENLFIIGERGMGKTSLASFVKYISETKNDFVGIHVNLSGINTIEEMCKKVFENLLKETYNKPIFDKVKNFFKNHIKEVGLFGVSVQFNVEQGELKNLVANFIPSLRNIYEKLRETNKGIILILDDINGLADDPNFAHFLKSTVDEIATGEPLPLFLVLAGMHEIRDKILKHQPSAGRIFNIVDVKRLTDNESTEFFTRAFESRNIKVNDDAMYSMVKWSSGLPMLIHEIGDSIYWNDKDGIIDRAEAINGILTASTNVGQKILDRQVLNAIRSAKYKSILKKMKNMELKLEIPFSKKEVMEKLGDSEKKTFDNFVQRMKQLGVLKNGEQRGEYEFTNNVFFAYLMIVADLGPEI